MHSDLAKRKASGDKQILPAPLTQRRRGLMMALYFHCSLCTLAAVTLAGVAAADVRPPTAGTHGGIPFWGNASSSPAQPHRLAESTSVAQANGDEHDPYVAKRELDRLPEAEGRASQRADPVRAADAGRALSWEQVAEIQQQLNDLGYDAGTVDGLSGSRTRAAIRAFQERHELIIDGEPSAELLGHLNSAAAGNERPVGGSATGSNEARPRAHSCDRLAAYPEDPGAATRGVYHLSAAEAARAIDACEQALVEFPGEQRFRYQYARALRHAERDDEAVELYRQLAEEGYATAHVALGAAYEGGAGVLQHYGKALQWYLRAAEEDQPLAQVRLAWMYLNGRGVPQSDAEALNWARKAAQQGSAIGQYALGWMYDAGRGIESDSAEALRWIREAAEQEYPRAEAYLGNFYLQGRGVRQDTAGAVQLFRRAAEKGDSYGQKMLGWAYLEGRGVRQDPDEAAQWLRKAAVQEDEWALEALGTIDTSLQTAVSEELRRKKEKKEAKQAEFAAQHRRDAAREERSAAAQAATTVGAAVLDLPPSELLVQALEDLAWTVTEKIEADVDAVAHAFWDAGAWTGSGNPSDNLLAPLEVLQEASVNIERPKNARGMEATLDATNSLLEFSTALICLSLCQNGDAEANAPAHLDRTRMMLEVGNLYMKQQDYLDAARLYLLGFGDLASPVRVPRSALHPIASGEGWLWGVSAIADPLREELQATARAIRSVEFDPDADFAPVLAQLTALAEQIEKAADGSSTGATADRSASLKAAADGAQLGAVAALNAVRRQLNGAAAQGGDVIAIGRTYPGEGRVAWTGVYQAADGSTAGEVSRIMVWSRGQIVPALSKQYAVPAAVAPILLAYEMLITLPLELTNLSRLIVDALAASRATAGLGQPNEPQRADTASSGGGGR